MIKKMAKDLAISLSAMEDTSVAELHKIFKDSFRSKEFKVKLNPDTRKVARKLITRIAKTPPSFLKSAFKFAVRNKDRASLTDSILVRWWVAANRFFGGAWRYEKGDTSSDWKDSVRTVNDKNKSGAATGLRPKTTNPYNKTYVETFVEMKVPAPRFDFSPKGNQHEALTVKLTLKQLEESIKHAEPQARLLEFSPKDPAKPEVGHVEAYGKLTSFKLGSKFMDGWHRPNNSEVSRGYMDTRVIIRHSTDVEELLKKMQEYLQGKKPEYTPFDVKKASIQDRDIVSPFWLAGLAHKFVYKPNYEKTLKEILAKRGCKVDVKIKVKEVKLNKHDTTNKDPLYALFIHCAKKDEKKLYPHICEIYKPTAMNATLPEAAKCFAVPDVSSDTADAQAKGLNAAAKLMAHHKAITESHVAINTKDIKDLYGHRVGGDGMNLQELLMAIKHPSAQDSTAAHCLYMYIGPCEQDPSTYNVVVERDDQATCKSIISTAYFSIKEFFGEETAREWLTDEAIETAKASYKEVDGKYVSALGNHLEELADAVVHLDMNVDSEQRALMVELLKDQMQTPKSTEPCLISGMELLDGFKKVTVCKEKKLFSSESSVVPHSIAKSECSIAEFSIESSDEGTPDNANGAASRKATSVMGDASIAESSVESDINVSSVMGDASIAVSTVPSKKGKSIAEDLSIASSDNEDRMEEDEEVKV